MREEKRTSRYIYKNNDENEISDEKEISPACTPQRKNLNEDHKKHPSQSELRNGPSIPQAQSDDENDADFVNCMSDNVLSGADEDSNETMCPRVLRR